MKSHFVHFDIVSGNFFYSDDPIFHKLILKYIFSRKLFRVQTFEFINSNYFMMHIIFVNACVINNDFFCPHRINVYHSALVVIMVELYFKMSVLQIFCALNL